jgi:hypothetical protein
MFCLNEQSNKHNIDFSSPDTITKLYTGNSVFSLKSQDSELKNDTVSVNVSVYYQNKFILSPSPLKKTPVSRLLYNA